MRAHATVHTTMQPHVPNVKLSSSNKNRFPRPKVNPKDPRLSQKPLPIILIATDVPERTFRSRSQQPFSPHFIPQLLQNIHDANLLQRIQKLEGKLRLDMNPNVNSSRPPSTFAVQSHNIDVDALLVPAT